VTPRLTSTFWVHAFLRRCAGQGIFGAVVRKGADEAGVVFVAINHLDGSYDLLAPAPGPSVDETGERRWCKAFSGPVAWPDVDTLVQRRCRTDPDIWLVEVEDRNGLAGLVPLVD
jgi:hypothetical protein